MREVLKLFRAGDLEKRWRDSKILMTILPKRAEYQR